MFISVSGQPSYLAGSAMLIPIITVEPFSLIHWEVDSKNIFNGNNGQVS